MTPLDSTAPAPADATPRTIDKNAPFFIVMNAGSGKKQGDETKALIEEALGAAKRWFEFRLVENADDLVGVAQRAVADAKTAGGIVVGAGGDGTLCAVAQAVYGSGCAFAVLPRGTFNYFSRDHGIPAEPAEAIALMLRARSPCRSALSTNRCFWSTVSGQRKSWPVSQTAGRS